MKQLGGILACGVIFLSSNALLAQTNVAPVAPAAASEEPQTPSASGAAEQAEVPITSDRPAPVTEPGAPVTHADPIVTTGQIPPASEPPAPVAGRTDDKDKWLHLDADPDAYSVVSAGKGLSLHKPMYVLPLTYSEPYHGKNTETIFQISLKQRLFGVPLYFGYTQKSFFDVYNSQRSKPFRETDYNPELFYRYIPADRERWHHLGVDFGAEHESNGKDLPDSRSWNRLYIAPFQAEGEHVFYWKWWYRIPEDKSLPRTDPNRDDNPDIQSYYGYSEIHYEQQLFNKHLAAFMFRYNPTTGRGALNFNYTIPNKAADPSFFWMFYLFQGYGEDLIDYNHSMFRIGVGLALAR